jgi:hypothetical protein
MSPQDTSNIISPLAVAVNSMNEQNASHKIKNPKQPDRRKSFAAANFPHQLRRRGGRLATKRPLACTLLRKIHFDSAIVSLAGKSTNLTLKSSTGEEKVKSVALGPRSGTL